MKLTTNISSLTRRLGLMAIAAAAATGLFSSCDSVIYDDEGDCDPHYKVRFRYDYHLKKGDAFPYEVNAVTLYVVDPATGNIVWRKTAAGDSVCTEGFTMDIDGIAPGNYKLMAWAGDGHLDSPSFTMGEGEHHTDLTARINRNAGNEVTGRIDRLYKDLDFEFTEREFTDEQGTHLHTVRLMKNTNDITVVLQHLSGEPVDASRFEYQIVEMNGSMDFDNSIMPDDSICYRPWRTRQGLADGIVPENMAEAKFQSAIADFTVGRLMADQKMWLRIYLKPETDAPANSPREGAPAGERRIVAQIPLVDYALMVKNNDGVMPDQEYLDRRDDYSMVFFLDDGMRWVSTQVIINSWKIVNQEWEG